MENNTTLDSNLTHDQDLEPISADPDFVKKAYMWAYLGGIGGLVMGHKLAYGSKFINGRVQYIYDEDSRKIGRKIQRVGLLIWIPLYLGLIALYMVWIFSIMSEFTYY